MIIIIILYRQFAVGKSTYILFKKFPPRETDPYFFNNPLLAMKKNMPQCHVSVIYNRLNPAYINLFK